MPADIPFWKSKSLEEMTRDERESLCDGCGRCCLHKLRDDETGALSYTSVSCRLLDLRTCRCRDYGNRHRRVPDCVNLSPAAVREIDWLPPSCAYRRLAEGRGFGLVASARLGRPGDGAPGGRLGARPGDERAIRRAARASSGRMARTNATDAEGKGRIIRIGDQGSP